MSTQLKKHYCFDIEDEKFLDDMGRVSGNFDFNVFMYAYMHKNFPKEEMLEQIDEVNERIEIIRGEYYSLKSYQNIFVNSLLTKNNELFDCTLQIYRKIKRTIVGARDTMNLYSDSVPSKKCRGPYKDTELPLVFNSSIATPACMGYMFPEESEGDGLLAQMYKVFKTYFDEWTKMVALCKETLNKIDEVRKDPDFCFYLFRQYRNGWLKKKSSLLNNFSLVPRAEDKPIIKMYVRHGGITPTCAQGLYHNYDEDDGDVLMCRVVEDEAKHYGLSPVEIKIFGEDHNRAMEARSAIKDFDTICPVGKNGKLNAGFIAVFVMVYNGNEKNGVSEKQFVEDYFFKHYSGTRGHVKYSAINKQKGLLAFETIKEYKKIIEDYVTKEGIIHRRPIIKSISS